MATYQILQCVQIEPDGDLFILSEQHGKVFETKTTVIINTHDMEKQLGFKLSQPTVNITAPIQRVRVVTGTRQDTDSTVVVLLLAQSLLCPHRHPEHNSPDGCPVCSAPQ